MRKLSLFLTGLLCMLCTGVWAAANDMPRLTTDEANPIWYTIASYNRGGYLTSNGAGAGLTHVALTVANTGLWYLTAAEGNTSGSASDGVILHNYDGTLLATSWKTSAEGSTVYIIPNGVNANGLTICKAAAVSGYNCLDANNSNNGVGNWHPSASDWQGTTWVFAEAQPITFDDALQTAIENAEARIIGVPVSDVATLQAAIATAKTKLGRATEADVTTLEAAIAALSTGSTQLYLPSGYYHIKGMDAARYPYLYTNFAAEGKDAATYHHSPLAGLNGEIWKVTNNGTSIQLINGEGLCLSTVSQNGGPVTATFPTLDFGAANGQPGIYFTQAINLTNWGNDKKLVTWTDGGPTKADNRWTFEAVDVAAGVYDVVVNGLADGYVTFGGENARNGGFFVSATAPTSSTAVAHSVEGYNTAVSVSGHTITATYTAVYPALVENAKEQAIAKAETLGTISALFADADVTVAKEAIAAVVSSGVTTETAYQTAVAQVDEALSTLYQTAAGKRFTYESRINCEDGETQRYLNAAVAAQMSTSLEKSATTVFALEYVSDGVYKIKASYLDKYLNSVNVTDEGSDYDLICCGEENYVSLQFHGTTDAIHHQYTGHVPVRWTTNAGASKWYIAPVSDDDYALLVAAMNLPQDGKYYRIKGKVSGGYIYNDGTTGQKLSISAEKGEDLSSIFYYSEGKLLNLTAGKYMVGGTLSATGADTYAFSVSVSDIAYLNIKPSSTNYLLDWTSGKTDYWSNPAGQERCDWLVEEVDVADLLRTITYTYTCDGQTVGSETFDNVVVGSAYPTPATLPAYCSVTLPESTVSANATLPLEVVVNAPFEASADYANAKWYTIHNQNLSYYPYYNSADESYLPLAAAVDMDNVDAFQWAFIGNPFTGYQIVNKAAGADHYMYIATPANDAKLVMSEDATTFQLVQGNAGGRFGLKAGNFYMNDYAGNHKLSFWQDAPSQDAGSNWIVGRVSSDIIKLAISVTGETEAENTRAGKVTMTLNSAAVKTYLDGADAEAKTFMGFIADDFTAAATSYAGYTFTGFSIGDTDYGTSIEAGELAGVTSGATLVAHYTASTGNGVNLWYDYSDDMADAYRLPAIVKTQSGRLIAFADYRPGNTDVGGGNTSIERRYSDDNGQTWSEAIRVAQGRWGEQGLSSYIENSFGDPAAVADNTEGNSGQDVLMVCAGGNRLWPYSTYNADNSTAQLGIALWRSADGGETWSSYTDITPAIMQAFEAAGIRTPEAENAGIVRAFFSSGKITQSSRKAAGAAYNRIYSAIVVNGGDVVVYSDDFGAHWTVLGACIANSGDEAHVVELPDGALLLVGKGNQSRYVNVFNYTDFDSAAGEWGEKNKWNNARATSCHGDVECVVAYDEDGNQNTVVIETAPTDSGQRRNIQYYYVAVPKTEGFSVNDFAINGTDAVSWTMGKNVTPNWGAYSSLVSLGGGRYDILFEVCAAGETQAPSGYCLVYQHHNLLDITGGAYRTTSGASLGKLVKTIRLANEGNAMLQDVLNVRAAVLEQQR